MNNDIHEIYLFSYPNWIMLEFLKFWCNTYSNSDSELMSVNTYEFGLPLFLL